MVQGVEITTKDDGHSYILNKCPATGKLISETRCSTPAEVDTTLQNLLPKRTAWQNLTLDERIKHLKTALLSFADPSVSSELQTLISREMGKTLPESGEEVEEIYTRLPDSVLPLIEDANRPETVKGAVILREALGTIAIISPWNYPAGEILLHLLPALAAGNAVIVKPSEVTPLTGEFVIRKLLNLPPDSDLLSPSCISTAPSPLPIALAQGDGTIGAYLISHTGIDAVAMTGSTATGRSIAATCGAKLKPVILELGGKDPMIVFDDANLKRAAEHAVTYSICNAGQVCCSVERVYVASSVAEEFEKLVVEQAKGVKVGAYWKDGVNMGPLVSRTQKEIVERHVDDAVAKGARLCYQGTIEDSEEDDCRGGNFYPVTVLADVGTCGTAGEEAVMAREETFGPVVALSTFSGEEEEAIRLANDSPYGLSASVYTKDGEKGMRVSRRIRAGQVAINNWALAVAPVNCPWVGHKESGVGFHSGREGYRQFSLPKSVIFSEEEE